MRTVLRSALNQALKWELVSRNVATLVDPPKVERHEIHPLTPEQARTCLQATKGERVEALYSATLALGLRQGEALGLSWAEVDREARGLRVSKALQRVGGKLRLVEPKTKQSRRAIALPESVVRALRAYRARQLQERLVAGSRWDETGLVFTNTIGRPLEPRSVFRDFKRILAKAELPDQRFHDLRHCAASLLLVQGVHPRTVMELLGHSLIGLTMDTYSHVMPALKRDAADSMEAILTAGTRAS